MTSQAPAAERTLPHNLEAERSVLGTILASSGKTLDVVADVLVPTLFFRDAHQRIYKAMQAMYGRGDAIDLVTLKAELTRRNDLDAVGGPAYIAGLADGTPLSTNVAYYARIVRELASKREVIYLANKLLTKAYEPDGEPGALVEEAERGLLEISQHAVPGDLVPASEMVRNIYPVIDELQTSKRALLGVSTGLADVDRYTLGLHAGALVILAGLTSHGKTSLAMQIALHVSRTAPVAFFSVEMSQQEQVFRIISTLARVDGHHLRLGRLNMHEQQAVGSALADFAERRFWLDDSGKLSALQVRSRSRRLKAKHGLGLIVVDYLQIMEHPRADRPDLRVGMTAWMLKQIARELEVPVLVLSQFSRDVAKNERKPRLSDLKESGSIEQDADVVFLIYRPPPKSDGAVTESQPTQLILAKQRNGPIAEIDLVWLGEQYRFGEVESR